VPRAARSPFLVFVDSFFAGSIEAAIERSESGPLKQEDSRLVSKGRHRTIHPPNIR
jgi:hypothetical protein